MLENVRSRLIQIVRCHAHTIQKRATAPFSETPVRKGLQGCLQSGLGASPAARRTRSHHRPFRHPSGSRLTRYGSEKVRFGSRTCPTYHVARASAWHACATCARAATCICVRACTLHGTRIELTNSNHLPRISIGSVWDVCLICLHPRGAPTPLPCTPPKRRTSPSPS